MTGKVENPALTEELRILSQDIRARQAQLPELEERRNALVRQALADGWTHQQIADATGLSRGRISQLKE
jgi:hypothetical protein